MSTRLVLASASPRRRDLLGASDIPFEVRPAEVDETPVAGESPGALVARLAVSKAEAVSGGEDVVVLGADTLDDQVLGKPVDPADATAMLRRLAGRTHRVLTGVAVVSPGRPTAVEAIATEVTFRALTDEEIVDYVATGEPIDKAGAYGIQGEGGALVASIDGPYDNVVGLPMDAVRRLLAGAGVAVPGPT